jgi:anti-sigma-K factor RskA
MTYWPDIGEDDNAAAGEYVLDLLPAEERRAFERRLLEEPALRAAVASWDDSFSRLTDSVAEVPAPPALQKRIERELFGGRGRRFSLPWVGGFAGAALAAMLAVAVLFMADPSGPVAPTHVAEVAAEDDSLRVEVALNAESGELRVERLAGAIPPGRSQELWLIADGAAAPVSLGLLDEDATVLALSEDQRGLLENAVLAISDEPEGGSPTGQPTGAVLATGQVRSS